MAQVVVGKNEYVPKDQNMDYEGNDIGQVKQSVSVVLALHTCACLSVLRLPEGERSGLGVSVVLCVRSVGGAVRDSRTVRDEGTQSGMRIS